MYMDDGGLPSASSTTGPLIEFRSTSDFLKISSIHGTRGTFASGTIKYFFNVLEYYDTMEKIPECSIAWNASIGANPVERMTPALTERIHERRRPMSRDIINCMSCFGNRQGRSDGIAERRR